MCTTAPYGVETASARIAACSRETLSGISVSPPAWARVYSAHAPSYANAIRARLVQLLKSDRRQNWHTSQGRPAAGTTRSPTDQPATSGSELPTMVPDASWPWSWITAGPSRGEGAVEQAEVGVADAAEGHLDEDLPGPGRGHGDVGDLEGVGGGVEALGSHGALGQRTSRCRAGRSWGWPGIISVGTRRSCGEVIVAPSVLWARVSALFSVIARQSDTQSLPVKKVRRHPRTPGQDHPDGCSPAPVTSGLPTSADVMLPSRWPHTLRGMDHTLAVDATGVTKAFGSVLAVANVSVQVEGGRGLRRPRTQRRREDHVPADAVRADPPRRRHHPRLRQDLGPGRSRSSGRSRRLHREPQVLPLPDRSSEPGRSRPPSTAASGSA